MSPDEYSEHDGVTFLATFRGQTSQRNGEWLCQIQQSKIMWMILKIT